MKGQYEAAAGGDAKGMGTGGRRAKVVSGATPKKGDDDDDDDDEEAKEAKEIREAKKLVTEQRMDMGGLDGADEGQDWNLHEGKETVVNSGRKGKDGKYMWRGLLGARKTALKTKAQLLLRLVSGYATQNGKAVGDEQSGQMLDYLNKQIMEMGIKPAPSIG